MRNYAFLVTGISMCLIMMAGCSSSNTSVTPIDDYQTLPKIEALAVGVSDVMSDGSPAEGMGTMGLFQLHLDPLNVTGELTSLRQSSLTDVLEVVDISNFLKLAPCHDCVKLRSVSLNDGNLVVSIGIKHPFEPGDMFKPITGRNRGDLHVFNVEGIVISSNTATNFPGIGTRVAGFRLLNASGYTGYLDNVLDIVYLTDANIHPYILHFDDYSSGNFNPNNPMGFESVTIPPPSGNLVMAMGSDYDYKDYVFDLDEGTLDFIYAVGCTYAVSAASKSQRFVPEFRIPQHNKKAASEVWVDIVENNLAAGDTDSSAILEINVVDLSHGVPVGTAVNEMFAESSVSSIRVEVPGVMGSPVNFSITPISGSGHDATDPLVFEGNILNTSSGGEGSYIGIVKVTDSYQPGMNTSPLLNGMDGIERVSPIQNPLEGLFTIDEFATYQVFAIDVGAGGDAPVCDLQVSRSSVGQGDSLVADPGDSYDPDGSIVRYEYDFNYDGVVFTPDVVQNSGDPDFGLPVNVTMPCNDTGADLIIPIALRVCDDSTPSLCTICNRDITVTEKLGDPGDVTVLRINRGEDGAYFSLITSVDLDWEDNPCGVAEYAIERGDGHTGTNWTVIGTSNTSDFKFQLSGLDWDDDIRLRVIARAVAGGNPASDSDPSQEVFLLFISNAGRQSSGNQWISHTEEREYSVFEFTTWHSAIIGDPGADVDMWWGSDTQAVALGFHVWGNTSNNPPYSASSNRWTIMIPQKPFPNLEGQKEAFCEGYFWTNNAWASGQGLALGTISDPNPDTSSETLPDFIPANDVYDTCYPYDYHNIEGLVNEFEAVGQSGWKLLGGSNINTSWVRVGYYLNDLLDEDRNYPALGMAVGSEFLATGVTVGWSDAWVFVVH